MHMSPKCNHKSLYNREARKSKEELEDVMMEARGRSDVGQGTQVASRR